MFFHIQSLILLLPLGKQLGDKAKEVLSSLNKYFSVAYDETGSIGKRYRREDEIGTPFCITFDFNTVGTETDPADHCVTIRERDSMEQVYSGIYKQHKGFTRK